jgi:hypothetical protein
MLNMDNVIVSNTIKCTLCNDIIYSAHRHDFKSCKCGSVSVDGGVDYLRRVGDTWTELSITMNEKVVNDCIAQVHDATIDMKNSRGIAYAVLRALRDNGYNLNNHE